MPPQHGKSLQVSSLFPAWYLGHYPDDPVILTAYGDLLAHDFSKDCRTVINHPEYQILFPGVKINPKTSAVNNWRLAAPHRGQLRAAGIYGSITGKGARLLGIDDPIKNREEAESELFRNKAKEAYKSTLSTRLHLDAIVLLSLTRWHEDDLAAWLLAQNLGFRYIRLPGIADCLDVTGKKYKRDLLGRKKGEALWPERFPVKMLLEQKTLLGTYDYSALYDQRPTPMKGLLFEEGYFKVIPGNEIPKGLTWFRFWDLAITETTAGDYTASARGAIDQTTGRRYFAGFIYGKWKWPVVRAKIKQVALAEQDIVALVGIEAAGTQGGMAQEMQFDKELAGVGIVPIPVSQSKRVRSLPVVAAGEAGLLYLEDGPLVRGWIDECLAFDKGIHDDRVDVLSGLCRMIGLGGGENVSLRRLLEDAEMLERKDPISEVATAGLEPGSPMMSETPEAKEARLQAAEPWYAQLIKEDRDV